MNEINKQIRKVIQAMENNGLKEQTKELKEIEDITQEDEEERPLYKATPTGIPGTWVEEDGDLIKTSKD